MRKIVEVLILVGLLVGAFFLLFHLTVNAVIKEQDQRAVRQEEQRREWNQKNSIGIPLDEPNHE